MPETTLAAELACRADRRGWIVEATVRGIAGAFVLASVALAFWVDMRWLWLAVFVAVNLIQSSITGWCLMSNMLAMAGIGSAHRGGRA